MQPARRIMPFLVICLLLAACSQAEGSSSSTSTPTATATKATTTVGVTPTDSPAAPDVDNSPLLCPAQLAADTNCQTPRSMRVAYGVESLMQRGFTGKGQTVVDIVSFGSPSLQADMDVFDRNFYLPPITIKVLAPLGTVPFDPASKDMNGWAGETELDVQIIHAIAPDAKIVVLTSPVSETEGTIGLPEFLKLEQYAVNNHLGTIISQSWGASEVTLKDSAGQQEIQKWDAFYKQATTQQGITFFGSSGDNGSTDFTDLNATILSKQPTTSFPTDEPWVTSVGILVELQRRLIVPGDRVGPKRRRLQSVLLNAVVSAIFASKYTATTQPPARRTGCFRRCQPLNRAGNLPRRLAIRRRHQRQRAAVGRHRSHSRPDGRSCARFSQPRALQAGRVQLLQTRFSRHHPGQ